MTSLVLTNYISFRKAKNIILPHINWRAFYAISVAVFAIATIICSFWANQFTRGVYLIDKYEKEIDVLYEESKTLETQFAESGFLGKVVDGMKVLNFEKTEEIKYIQILDTSLARAQ